MSGDLEPECLDTFLFDLDGTLIDSIDLIFRCYRHSAATHLAEQPPDSVWRGRARHAAQGAVFAR